MPLNTAQLMDIPGGPGVVGAITPGTGLSSTSQGILSVDVNQVCTKILAGPGITITPASGIGRVTIASTVTSEGSVPTGGKTIFKTATAPRGWVTDTNVSNRTIRLVSANGGSQGGATGFSSVYASQPITGQVIIQDKPLSSAQTDSVSLAPVGSLSVTGFSVNSSTLDSSTVGSHAHQYTDWSTGIALVFGESPDAQPVNVTAGGVGNNTGSALSSGSHTHGGNASASFSGTPASHQHTVNGNFTCTTTFTGDNVDLSIRYVDVLLCTKS